MCKVIFVVFMNLEVRFLLVGEMIVVLGLGFLGVFLYEVVGYGFEGDFYCKCELVFNGMFGERVVVFGVNVVDDVMLSGVCGLFNVDDEGVVG